MTCTIAGVTTLDMVATLRTAITAIHLRIMALTAAHQCTVTPSKDLTHRAANTTSKVVDHTAAHPIIQRIRQRAMLRPDLHSAAGLHREADGGTL